MDSAESPYPGLRTFTGDEAHLFFGREGHTDRLLEILAQRHFLAVIGPSGCGKSSLVRAGLLPGLPLGGIGTGHLWRVATFRPGSRPLEALAKAMLDPTALGPELDQAVEMAPSSHQQAHIEAELRRGPRALLDLVTDARHSACEPDFNLLVLVDQFEELFTHSIDGAANSDESEALVNLLLRAREDKEAKVFVVITLRTDFLGDCVRFIDLPDAINRGQFLTPRLTREQLASAICGPARQFGGDVEVSLIAELGNALETDQDELPVLQHALARMWRHASELRGTGPTLSLDDLENIGGISGALPRHAEELYSALAPEARGACEWLFRAITEQRSLETGGQRVRRPQRLDAIVAWGGLPGWQSCADVLGTFGGADARFLTETPLGEPQARGAGVIDISHEALIRRWPRLQAWIGAEARAARQYSILSDRAQLVREGQASLLQGRDLMRAHDWVDAGLASNFSGQALNASGAPHAPSRAWAARYATLDTFDRALALVRQSKSARTRARIAAAAMIVLVPLGVAGAARYMYVTAGGMEQQRAEELFALAEIPQVSARENRDRLLMRIATAPVSVRQRFLDRWLRQSNSAADATEHEEVLRAAVGLDARLAEGARRGLDEAVKRSAVEWMPVRALAGQWVTGVATDADIFDALLPPGTEARRTDVDALTRLLKRRIAEAGPDDFRSLATLSLEGVRASRRLDRSDAASSIAAAWRDGLDERRSAPLDPRSLQEIRNLFDTLGTDNARSELRLALVAVLFRHGQLGTAGFEDVARDALAVVTVQDAVSTVRDLLQMGPEARAVDLASGKKPVAELWAQSLAGALLDRLKALDPADDNNTEDWSKLFEALELTAAQLSPAYAQSAVDLVGKFRSTWRVGKLSRPSRSSMDRLAAQTACVELLSLRAHLTQNAASEALGRAEKLAGEGREIDIDVRLRALRRLSVIQSALDARALDALAHAMRSFALAAADSDELRAMRDEIQLLVASAEPARRPAIVAGYLGSAGGDMGIYSIAHLMAALDMPGLERTDSRLLAQVKQWLTSIKVQAGEEPYAYMALVLALEDEPNLVMSAGLESKRVESLLIPDGEDPTTLSTKAVLRDLRLRANLAATRTLSGREACNIFWPRVSALVRAAEGDVSLEQVRPLDDFVRHLPDEAVTALARSLVDGSGSARLREWRLGIAVVQHWLDRARLDAESVARWLSLARMPMADPGQIESAIVASKGGPRTIHQHDLPRFASWSGVVPAGDDFLAATAGAPPTSALKRGAASRSSVPASELRKRSQSERDELADLLADPFNLNQLQRWSTALDRLAIEQADNGMAAEAIETAERQYNVDRWRKESAPADNESLRDYVVSLIVLCRDLGQAGELRQAAEIAQKLRDASLELAKRKPAVVDAYDNLQFAWGLSSWIAYAQGDKARGRSYREQLLNVSRTPVPASLGAADAREWRWTYVADCNELIEGLVNLGEYGDASSVVARAIAAGAAVPGPYSAKEMRWLRRNYYMEGRIFEGQGRWVDAKAAFDRAKDLADRISEATDDDQQQTVFIESRRGRLMSYLGKHAEAVAALEEQRRKAMLWRDKMPSADTRETLAVQSERIGEVKLRAGSFQEAAIALAQGEQDLGDSSNNVSLQVRLLEILATLTQAQLLDGQLELASATAARARALLGGLDKIRKVNARIDLEELRLARLEIAVRDASHDPKLVESDWEQLADLGKRLQARCPSSFFVQVEQAEVGRLVNSLRARVGNAGRTAELAARAVVASEEPAATRTTQAWPPDPSSSDGYPD